MIRVLLLVLYWGPRALAYLHRCARRRAPIRTIYFRVADNPEVISHGTPIRDARCDHFYGKRVFRPSRLLPSGSSCALSLTRMDEASNWARGARRYYYEAFRTATEIREGKAAFPAGTFLLAEG